LKDIVSHIVKEGESFGKLDIHSGKKILCGRCGTLFGKIPNSGPKVCHLAKRALAGRTPDDQKQLDDWMNEGGICY
jgi:hypothetical protein